VTGFAKYLTTDSNSRFKKIAQILDIFTGVCMYVPAITYCILIKAQITDGT
jgi:hypothetical protein